MWRFSYKVAGYIAEQWVSGIIGNGKAIHAVEVDERARKRHTFCGGERTYSRDLPVSVLHTEQQINCKRCLAKIAAQRKMFGVSDWQEE